jgi:DNA-binding response OmpR family regulator
MNELIAIVDDEKDIAELIAVNLKKAGFKIKEFYDGQSFLAFLSKQEPDVIILDLMLPDTDGIEICKYVRKEPKLAHIPIIMLTARAEETDKIIGLELGADDYVTKPFSPKELVARVKAILRRKQKPEQKTIVIGGLLSIDPLRFEVTVEGENVILTSTEFKILELLASRKGLVFSRNKLLDYLWGEEKAVLDRTIDVHIKHLREKLGAAGKFIINVRGIGYKLQE